MVRNLQQETHGVLRRGTRRQTRATPAFHVVIPLSQPDERTEEIVDGNPWPDGIDYTRVKVPSRSSEESVADRLDVLELLDD